MASRQTPRASLTRNAESDLRETDLSVSTGSYRLHRSNTDPEDASEHRRGVRMTFAENTLADGDAFGLPPVHAHVRVGPASGYSEEERAVELDQMVIDAPPSTKAHDASDESSETMMKDEAELLMSLREKQPYLSDSVIGCTFKNIRYIYLTQQSIHKLMSLETTMKAQGWDLSVAKVELIKGVAVLVAHEDNWKLRRNRKNLELHLEDRTIVTLLQISDCSLEENDVIQDFVIGELNYQIEKSQLDPIAFHQLADIYTRLALCGFAMKKIQRGANLHRTLQGLAQGLMHPPLVSFLDEFRSFVDPMSAADCRRASKLYVEKLRFVGNHLPSIWRSWLGQKEDEDMTLEDTLIFNAEAMPLRISTPRFLHSAVAATDPRRSSGLHMIHTDDQTMPIMAPRRPISSRAMHRNGQSNGRVRLRSLNNVHRECMIKSELQCNIAYESLTDAERALRRVRRNYKNDGNGFDVQ